MDRIARAVSRHLTGQNEPLENGKLDFRIQKQDYYTKRYRDMYLLDNQMQLDTCLEDPEYTKWLDPEGVPCYVKDDSN